MAIFPSKPSPTRQEYSKGCLNIPCACRDELFKSRSSRLVRESPISLESEIFRCAQLITCSTICTELQEPSCCESSALRGSADMEVLFFRELQVDNYFEQNAQQQPSSARSIQANQQIGPADPPVWKDDSWRIGNRFKSPGGPSGAETEGAI